MVVAQEQDIIAIIDGFKNILNHGLSIKGDDNDLQATEDKLKTLKKGVDSDERGGFLSFFLGKKEIVFIDTNQKIKDAIFENLK